MSEHEIDTFKNDLQKSIKEYGFSVQAPLIHEVALLYIEICKDP